ncbi:MAG TPA: PqqD family protein [Synechococcales cyanobacterium M55_K2018_004]|nr:PqqD family protein [Synechococcales cyanobacterium M55_K2018_004]
MTALSETPLTDQTQIVATSELVASELAGEVVILSLKSGLYYGLNEVGSCIWNLIQQPISVAEIRQALLSQYEVEFDQCDRDLKALLSDLSHAGLVEIR